MDRASARLPFPCVHSSPGQPEDMSPVRSMASRSRARKPTALESRNPARNAPPMLRSSRTGRALAGRFPESTRSGRVAAPRRRSAPDRRPGKMAALYRAGRYLLGTLSEQQTRRRCSYHARHQCKIAVLYRAGRSRPGTDSHRCSPLCRCSDRG